MTAAAISLSPVAIGVTIVLLMSSGGLVKAAGFAVGWATVVLAAASGAYHLSSAADVEADDAVNTGVSVLQLALGVVFIVLAFVSWRRRPRRGETPSEPKLFARVDAWSNLGAVAGGVAAATINVKTIPLSLSGGLRLAQQPADGAAITGALVLFVVAASLGSLVPWAATAATAPDRRMAMLRSGRSWIAANLTTITIVVLLLAGANMIAKGLTG